MCTITLLRQPDGIRLFMNRDEAYNRPVALPPQPLARDVDVYGPRDPQGGGTWIAYSGEGYWGCLLNGYLEQDSTGRKVNQNPEPISRGRILPSILSSKDPFEAQTKFDPSGYSSFSVLIGDKDTFRLYSWDGDLYQETEFHCQLADKAFFITSSSWRKAEVVAARVSLFKEWASPKLGNIDRYTDIPEYHLRSNLHPTIAPFMRRPGAGTQSITSLKVCAEKIEMNYRDLSGQSQAEKSSTTAMARSKKTETSFFEFWPLWAMYLPVALEWLIQALRYRSLMLPFAANPSLTLAGMIGMPKSELMSKATGKAAESILPWILYSVSSDAAEIQAASCISQTETEGITLPFVCKPNLGCRGAGVKLVETEAQLAQVIAKYPKGAELICQRLSEHEPEVGIFFVRDPKTGLGEIPSMTQKILPKVIGDGVSSLGELIEADPRAGKLSFLYRERHRDQWHKIPAKDEIVRLVFSASHSKGAIFQDASNQVTEALCRAVEEIAAGLPDFYYGRMDVKFPDLQSLQAGRGLEVIEVNGASAESIHIWDKNTKFLDAVNTLRWQYRTLFRIGAFHRRNGAQVPSIRQFLSAWKADRELAQYFPTTD